RRLDVEALHLVAHLLDVLFARGVRLLQLVDLAGDGVDGFLHVPELLTRPLLRLGQLVEQRALLVGRAGGGGRLLRESLHCEQEHEADNDERAAAHHESASLVRDPAERQVTGGGVPACAGTESSRARGAARTATPRSARFPCQNPRGARSRSVADPDTSRTPR